MQVLMVYYSNYCLCFNIYAIDIFTFYVGITLFLSYNFL